MGFRVPKNPKFASFFLFWAFHLFVWVSQARAILPISQNHDLVAGEGAKGFRDGSFYSSLFNFPQGLAVDPSGKELFVADRDNHRIRVVELDRENQVRTLAGSNGSGCKDGALSSALFDRPSALVMIPGGKLVVYDQGNRKLRLLDLVQKNVSTLAGNGSDGIMDGDALHSSLGGVWNLAYSPREKAVYFTQPIFGALRKLDLVQRKITTILRQDPRLLKPRALCVFQGRVCVAGDGIDSPVFLLDPSVPPSDKNFMSEIGKGTRVLSLGSTEDSIYALQSSTLCPWVKIHPLTTPQNDPGLISVWGGVIQYIRGEMDSFFNSDLDDAAGIIADPRQSRRLFVSSGYLGSIVGLKNYDYDELIRGDSLNREGRYDFEYPPGKPPRTFRILVVGDSYVFQQGVEADRRWGWKGGGSYGNRMESVSKQLELLLNTEACLRDVPKHFEVLTLCQPASYGPPYLWLLYQSPRIIRDYGIDLVLYFTTSSSWETSQSFRAYLERPITSEGIPAESMDREYLLKPWREKIPEGVVRDFYDRASTRGWIRPLPNNQFFFEDSLSFLSDQKIKQDLEELISRPIALFQREIKGSRTKGGGPIGFQVCFLPIRDTDRSRFQFDHLEEFRTLWGEVAQKARTPFLDLTAPFIALGKTYWPIDGSGSGNHLNVHGHFLTAYILSRELVDHGLVPFRPIKRRKP